MKFDKLTIDQISLLKDPSKTALELAELFGFGVATIHRWRKTLGVKITIGSKKGKPRPWQIKQEERSCLYCGNYSLGFLFVSYYIYVPILLKY